MTVWYQYARDIVIVLAQKSFTFQVENIARYVIIIKSLMTGGVFVVVQDSGTPLNSQHAQKKNNAQRTQDIDIHN